MISSLSGKKQIIAQMASIFLDEWEEDKEDWYHDSDTSEDIPDPNFSAARLYQEIDKLPVGLENYHLQEGAICTMTLEEKKTHPMLIMIVETSNTNFLYRVFFVQKSKQKTWHQGAEDKKTTYDKVWRLASRGELIREEDPRMIRSSQTIRFS